MPSRVLSNPVFQGVPFWFFLITCMFLLSVSCILGVSLCTVNLRPYYQVHYTDHGDYFSPILPILPCHVLRYLERAQIDKQHFQTATLFNKVYDENSNIISMFIKWSSRALCNIYSYKTMSVKFKMYSFPPKTAIKDKSLLRIQSRKNHFLLPPQPHKPLTNPVIPAPAALFLFSIFSANEGKATWFNAKSKNRGLHGTGTMGGGNLMTLGAVEVKLLSSTNSSRRRARLWMNRE